MAMFLYIFLLLMKKAPNNMKNLLYILSIILILGSCTVFQSKPKYEIGMEESTFLRKNKSAVISNLEGDLKTYRVVRAVLSFSHI